MYKKILSSFLSLAILSAAVLSFTVAAEEPDQNVIPDSASQELTSDVDENSESTSEEPSSDVVDNYLGILRYANI